LDIDLDYFNLMDNPGRRFEQLLGWADCQVSFVVEKHHNVLPLWKNCINKGHISDPQFILHVDVMLANCRLDEIGYGGESTRIFLGYTMLRMARNSQIFLSITIITRRWLDS
jgi:hypothetical protein